MTPTIQEMPEYCTFVVNQGDTSQASTVILDGARQIQPEISDGHNAFQFLLPRADNGRGNGVIQYSNPGLPIGDDHTYALMEAPTWIDAMLFPGTTENGELEFEITNLEKRRKYSLYKVLTVEEVNQCNPFLDPAIDLENVFQVDGMVYIPLSEYGIMDQFKIGIQASDQGSGGEDTDGDGVPNVQDACPNTPLTDGLIINFRGCYKDANSPAQPDEPAAAPPPPWGGTGREGRNDIVEWARGWRCCVEG